LTFEACPLYRLLDERLPGGQESYLHLNFSPDLDDRSSGPLPVIVAA
jgi:hypothetical protein